MSGPVRVAVIGCGLIARRAHLPGFAGCDEAEVAAVVSGRIETARAAAAEFGVARVLGSWQEAVTDPEIDAVDICTPNALHGPIAVAAARAGKHVLVEKPMALSLAEADAMVAAAHVAGVVLMVAHNQRFVPAFAAAKRAIDEGLIGRPFAARGVFMHAGPDETWGATSDWFWREETAGGGAMLDLGVHMIDLVRWLIGRPVRAVTAMTARVAKPTYADDNAIAVLRFEGDALASVQASWSARPFPSREVTVHGETGHLVAGRSPDEPLVVYVQDGGGVRKIVPEVPVADAVGDPCAHFARCIREGTPPLIDGAEGRASLAATLAAYESARTGRTVEIAG